MDSVASNTSKEESTHVSPQYDSSEEWEIGLGNLIIDLDADLEKDRQDGGAGGGGSNGSGTSVDSSPLRIGKMKIKRKVSTNTATTPKGSESGSPRKDNLLSAEDSEPCGHISPTPEKMVKEEKIVTKSVGRNISGGSVSVGPHHKHDSVAVGASKHLDKIVTNTKGSKPLTSGDIQHTGKYSSGQEKESVQLDNNVCRIKTSVDHKPQTLCKKEKETTIAGGCGKKKEEKEGKGETTTGKKGSDGGTKKHGGKKRGDKISNSSSSSVGVGTSDAETLTEPECLGPCEPGTSVNLEGIVWHETDQGVLVVNVTWRNKTYVGTLLDCTRHDWAPPRFCDSPTSDVENRTNKACGRPKRGRAINTNSNDMSNFTETRSSVHSKLRNPSVLKGRKGTSANVNKTLPATGMVEKSQGKRKHHPVAETSTSSGDDTKSAKRLKSSTKHNAIAVPAADVIPETPSGLIECPEPNCSKKYKHINGLRYHRQHAHQDDKPEEEDDDSENKSSSDESSSVGSVTQADNVINIVKSKSDWSDSNRTSGASTNDTKVASVQQADQTAENRQLQYSTAAANAAATAAANAAAAANMELLQSKEDAPTKTPKGHTKQMSSDKTNSKLLHSTLGKSKDGTPAKSKGELPDKLTGKHKKGHSSTEKDLSVFDFNSAVESDGVNDPSNSDKHVSVIRPIADVSTACPVKSSAEAVATVVSSVPAKLQDVIHTTPLPGSEHLEDMQKHSKKSDKDKSKAGDRKKGKHDKVPSNKVKPTRPVVSSPTPPQLVAIPASVTAKGAGMTQPPKMPTINTKPSVNTALKPIQPKPTVVGEAVVSSPVTNPKEKKSKSKKKSKDKDKEREKSSSCTKDKESKDATVANNKQGIQPPLVTALKQPVPPVVPTPSTIAKQQTQPGTVSNVLSETNILHQALTASGIGPEDAERNSPSVTNSSEIPKTDPSQTLKDQTKDVRPVFPNRQPVHGSMPEMPKLIPTSSVVNSINAVQPQLPPHQVKPIQPAQDNSNIEKSAISLPQIKTTLLVESGAQNAPAGQTEESRAQSPAYSDISDANEESEVPAKVLNDRDRYSFPDASRSQAKVDEHMHSKSLFSPLSDVGRERFPDGLQKSQQDTLRIVPPIVQPTQIDTSKESVHSEGPEAKKPRKDTSSPRLPSAGEAGCRPPSQTFPGQYSYMPGIVMDQQYHMRLFKTDPHYRQQHEQFRQEQRQIQEKERLERERHEHSTKEKILSSKVQEENRERTIPRIKTEPVTPPKRNVLCEKGQERSKTDRPHSGGDMLKRKQLDFHKPGAESVASSEASAERSAQEEPARHGPNKGFMNQRNQEFCHYQQKVQEQQKFEEEQRRKLEESCSEGSSVQEKEVAQRSTQEEPTRSSTPQQHNPPKSRSPATSSVEERKLRQSPSCPSPVNRDPKVAVSSSSSKRMMDYPAYLQHTPYGPVPMHQTPYGPIPIDPNHPAYHQHVNPLVAYPAYLGHDLRFAAGPMVSPVWKSPDEKGHFEHERSRAISPHQASTSRGASPSDPPPKALDLLQQHASRYYNNHKHDRPRSPNSKSRTSSPQRKPTSPRQSPETLSASRSEQVQAMIHQHMHTHQHTHHVGMGYPPVLPPYDPYVIASQQAAAAAAGVPTPYTVRRETMPP